MHDGSRESKGERYRERKDGKKTNYSYKKEGKEGRKGRVTGCIKGEERMKGERYREEGGEGRNGG